MALGRGQGELLFQSGKRSGLRNGVGHVETGGDTTGGSSPGLTFDICLGGESGFAEMHMIVDDTGDDQRVISHGSPEIFHTFDAFTLYHYRSSEAFSFVDDGATDNGLLHDLRLHDVRLLMNGGI